MYYNKQGQEIHWQTSTELSASIAVELSKSDEEKNEEKEKKNSWVECANERDRDQIR